ncbi:MAG: CPBP family intramembrane glutamic endopeptidase [Saprospiraceae bacterium]
MSLKSKQSNEEIASFIPPKKHLFYTNGLMLIIGALLVLSSWNMSERSWSVLGVSTPSINIYGVISMVVLAVFYISDMLYSWFNRPYLSDKMKDMSFVIPLNWLEYRHYIFLAFAAGICEEIIFRGFLINYMAHLLGDIPYSYIIAIIIPSVVFAISHLYQGWWAVIKIFIIAILLGLIYFYSASLLWVIIIHIAIDLISGLVGILGPKSTSDMVD